jgi:elongation factor G
MFGYIGDLRTMTSGRANSPWNSATTPCPKNVSNDVIAKARDEALRAAK